MDVVLITALLLLIRSTLSPWSYPMLYYLQVCSYIHKFLYHNILVIEAVALTVTTSDSCHIENVKNSKLKLPNARE